MGDIKRNSNKQEPVVVEKKEVEVVKDNNVQIHFGNAELIKIKLLESINKQLSEVVTILKTRK